MRLPPIEPYIFVTFWISGRWKKGFPADWQRRESFIDWIDQGILDSTERFGPVVSTHYPQVVEEIFEQMLEAKAIVSLENEVSGRYYKIDEKSLGAAHARALNGHPIKQQVDVVGIKLLDDVFEVYAKGDDVFHDLGGTDFEIEVPASDRIVSVSDNQREIIAEAVEVVDEELSKENSIDGDVDLRSRYLSQLKAARELLRSSSISAHLFYETLFRLLGHLIAKYKGKALGVAASRLLELAIENIFKAQ